MRDLETKYNTVVGTQKATDQGAVLELDLTKAELRNMLEVQVCWEDQDNWQRLGDVLKQLPTQLTTLIA